MVEQSFALDLIFGSLSDRTRRDILRRVSKKGMSVGEIAKYYGLTFAGIAKHLQVLQRAGLVSKTRRGKEQIVNIAPTGLSAAEEYIKNFEKHWENRLNNLEKHLKTINK